ncbi:MULTISPECIES: hypothetical protein [Moraxella]
MLCAGYQKEIDHAICRNRCMDFVGCLFYFDDCNRNLCLF